MLNRKEKEAVTKGRYVEMEQSMLKLITTSQHISRGKYRTFLTLHLATRGKALSLLNVSTKKRTRKQANMNDDTGADAHNDRRTNTSATTPQQPSFVNPFLNNRRFAYGPNQL